MGTTRSRSQLLLKKLVAKKIISEEQKKIITDNYLSKGVDVIQALSETMKCGKEEVFKSIARTHELSYINLDRYKPDQDLLSSYSPDMVRKYRFLPLVEEDNTLTIATDSPLTMIEMDDLSKLLKKRLKLVITTTAQLDLCIDKYFSEIDENAVKAVENVLEHVKQDAEVQFDEPVVIGVGEKLPEGIDVKDVPVIKLVNNILQNAIKRRASDIHIEAENKFTLMRYRIDGVLFDAGRFPKYFHPPLISRLKILSGLNLAERRLPQNGHFNAVIEGKQCDFRVSTIPTIFGEKCVLRVLDRTYVPQSIKDLGLNNTQLELLIKLLEKPHGILLVSGPTGSGKTTTLYAALEYLNNRELNIVTVEDPVEYNKQGINQIQVHNKIGLTFEIALENILRQDPDVVMLGEIRSSESAAVAMRAALTGHLLLSTIHTNSAVETITRLLDLGIEPYLVGSCLAGSIAQRLVRKVCDKCFEPKAIGDHELEDLPLEIPPGTKQRVGTGCAMCNYIGYRGRAAVFEILPITERLKRLIYDRKVNKIYDAAQEENFITLRQHLAWLITNGITTIDEAASIVY